MSFGKSKARLLSEDQVKTTLADVAGCDEAKEEVGELVEFLRDRASSSVWVAASRGRADGRPAWYR
jgi:membrane protease FtsH catalytic subunit (EC 3.4.24.-)